MLCENQTISQRETLGDLHEEKTGEVERRSFFIYDIYYEALKATRSFTLRRKLAEKAS